jgi:hypothetical protein
VGADDAHVERKRGRRIFAVVAASHVALDGAVELAALHIVVAEGELGGADGELVQIGLGGSELLVVLLVDGGGLLVGVGEPLRVGLVVEAELGNERGDGTLVEVNVEASLNLLDESVKSNNLKGVCVLEMGEREREREREDQKKSFFPSLLFPFDCAHTASSFLPSFVRSLFFLTASFGLFSAMKRHLTAFAKP